MDDDKTINMKLTKNILTLFLSGAFFFFAFIANAKDNVSSHRDLLYQYSIIDALLAGVFDGDLTFGELKKKGDFGIGTFNQIDGELMMLDGKVYRIRHTGEVVEASDDEKTPLAFVNFFKADTTFFLEKENMTSTDVENHISHLFNGNYLYAIQIRGEFKNVTARSVRPATAPYPTLTEHIQQGGQQLFEFHDIKGLMGGYFLPAYMAKINVPGFHMHFLSDDLSKGGHLYTYTADRLEIKVDYLAGFLVENSHNAEFQNIDLVKDRAKELHSVEK